MNVPKSISLLLIPAAAAALFLMPGCDISGGNSAIREVALNISGTYSNSGGIPERQSGNRIIRFSLSQTGDRLQAVDNQGASWSGSIGRASDSEATFTLKGMTSVGAEVVLTGTITVDGTDATMRGTWVEPGITAGAAASATVAPQPTPTPDPSPTPTPDPDNGVTPTPTPVPNSSSPVLEIST